jgi:hypothetical protein
VIRGPIFPQLIFNPSGPTVRSTSFESLMTAPPCSVDTPPPPYQATPPPSFSRQPHKTPSSAPAQTAHRPTQNNNRTQRQADEETGFQDCCCCSCCSEGCVNGFVLCVLALLVNAVLAGIWVGLIALFDHFNFANPFNVGPEDIIPPGSTITFVVLFVGGLFVWSLSGGVSAQFLDVKYGICAGLISSLITLFLFASWLFMIFEGHRYDWFKMTPESSS